MYNDGKYLEKHPSWHVEDSAWKAGQILGILKDNAIRPATVCDIGCGAGEVLLNLAREMPEATFAGYEISKDVFAVCKAKERGNVSFHLMDAPREETAHDLMLCIDVFEHVENCVAFLRGLAGKARYYVFHIPLEISVNSSLRDFILERARETDGHLHQFNRYTALHTLRHAGYEALDWRYTCHTFDKPLAGARERAAKLLRQSLHRLSPELCVRALGGFSLLVLARTQT